MKTAAWLITGGTFVSTSGPEIDDYDIELDTQECERLNIAGNGQGEHIPLVPAPQWQSIETVPMYFCARILLSDGESVWAPYWHAAMNRDGTDASGWSDLQTATHWMQQPEPPHGI